MRNFFFGMNFGILFVLLLTTINQKVPLNKCAKDNNVYECQYKAIPIKEHKNGSDKITPKKEGENV